MEIQANEYFQSLCFHMRITGDFNDIQKTCLIIRLKSLVPPKVY